MVLSKDKAGSPSSLAATSCPFAARATLGGLRNAEPVASVVPLHIFLEMHLELAICISGAGNAGEGIFSAARAELLGHLLGCEETGMAA